jgi:hypothetical protein
MSPKAQGIYDYLDSLNQRLINRRDRQLKHQQLLPPDLTGLVFNRARDEAGKIKERMVWLESERARVSAELAEARREVLRACSHVHIPGKRRGNILEEFSFEPDSESPTNLQLGPNALKLRQQKVSPLLARLKSIDNEIYARKTELNDLQKIAERASLGDVSLIHFLSDAWRARLEIGAGMIGKLPKPARLLFSRHTIFVDAYGNVLPPEALDDEGRPDLPKKKVG